MEFKPGPKFDVACNSTTLLSSEHLRIATQEHEP